VTFLQQQLIRVGYLTGTADGSFGQQTKDAVVKFQTDKKITPADGVVLASTWQALAAAPNA
jgi:peptidoglycan hydrolase-like protein with peptidoglycan-binding domain